MLTGEHSFHQPLLLVTVTKVVTLVLGTDLTDASDGSISSWSFDAYPIHTSLSVFEPGRYRLVLRSPGYAERSVTLDLRAGEYEEVEVTLSK